MTDPKYSIGEEVYVHALPSPVVVINRTWNYPGEYWIYTIKADKDRYFYVGEESLGLKPKKANHPEARPWMVRCPYRERELFDKAYLDRI